MANQSEVYYAVVLVCLFAMVSIASGYAIDQSTSSESNEAEAGALQTITDFRNKLARSSDQQEGVVEATTVDTIDELDVLQMLPKVISHLRKESLTAKERDAFERFYGSIWELIVEESGRHRGQPRNPILTALLASPEIRHGQQDIRHELGNDIEHNSVSKVYQAQGSSAKAIVFDEQELPQRVLRMAAAIVQKYYQRKAKAGPASRRRAVQARRQHQQRLRKMAAAHAKQLSEADSVRVTIEVPRFKRANHRLAASLADQDEVDEEIEAKIMAAIQAQIGNPSLEEDDDEDEEAEEPPAHHEDDSSEYLDDEADYMGILGDADDDDDDEDDDDDDDDEDIAADLLKAHAHNFENPSFNELLLLAARHRVTQQQKELELQHLAFRKTSSKADPSSSYEDY